MADKLLITGSSGVLGAGFKSVADDYPQYEFVFSDSKDCNLTRFDDTVAFVGAIKPKAIMHLAAVSGGIEFSQNHPAKLLRDNVYMNLNILEAARLHKTEKTVMTLSSGMYPVDAPIPLQETSIHQGMPHPSNASYAFAKRLVEPSIKAYQAEYQMNVIGLIPNGIFGEHGDFTHTSAAMWAALIRRFYENRHSKEDLSIWGDGSPLREHTYAPDMARAFLWCMENYDEVDVMNVGSTEEFSIKEIAEMIADILAIDRKRLSFDTTKPSGVHRKSFDNSKFIGLSNFEFTPFRVGLEASIRWFCTNYEQPGKVLL